MKKHVVKKTVRREKKMAYHDDPEPEFMSEEEPEAKPKDATPIVQRSEYGNQLVVDLDFTSTNPITLIHSFDSNLLNVSIISTGPPGCMIPSVEFTDSNTLTLTANTKGRFRCYIRVVPG